MANRIIVSHVSRTVQFTEVTYSNNVRDLNFQDRDELFSCSYSMKELLSCGGMDAPDYLPAGSCFKYSNRNVFGTTVDRY